MKQPLVQFLLAWLFVALILDYKFIQSVETEADHEEKSSKEGSDENEGAENKAVEKPFEQEVQLKRASSSRERNNSKTRRFTRRVYESDASDSVYNLRRSPQKKRQQWFLHIQLKFNLTESSLLPVLSSEKILCMCWIFKEDIIICWFLKVLLVERSCSSP